MQMIVQIVQKMLLNMPLNLLMPVQQMPLLVLMMHLPVQKLLNHQQQMLMLVLIGLQMLHHQLPYQLQELVMQYHLQ